MLVTLVGSNDAREVGTLEERTGAYARDGKRVQLAGWMMMVPQQPA